MGQYLIGTAVLVYVLVGAGLARWNWHIHYDDWLTTPCQPCWAAYARRHRLPARTACVVVAWPVLLAVYAVRVWRGGYYE